MSSIAADIYSLNRFKQLCREGSFIDYDGTGELVRLTIFPLELTKLDVRVTPSMIEDVDITNATHVVWYNK